MEARYFAAPATNVVGGDGGDLGVTAHGLVLGLEVGPPVGIEVSRLVIGEVGQIRAGRFVAACLASIVPVVGKSVMTREGGGPGVEASPTGLA